MTSFEVAVYISFITFAPIFPNTPKHGHVFSLLTPNKLLSAFIELQTKNNRSRREITGNVIQRIGYTIRSSLYDPTEDT